VYAQYIKERENQDIIQSEAGFLTYKIVNADCYLADLFILPEYRKTGAARGLFSQLIQIAKAAFCTRILTNIYPSTNGATTSIKTALALGGELLAAEQNLITLVRYI